MGSIADRMKALSGKGMDVGAPTHRMSKDMSATPPQPTNRSNGGIQATGGAGNYGPARTAATTTMTRPRAASQASASQSEPRSRSSSVKESKPPTITSTPARLDEEPSNSTTRHVPPIVAPKPKLPTPPSQSGPSVVTPIRSFATGSSTSSTKVNVGETLPNNSAPPSKGTSSKPPLPPIPTSSTSVQRPQHSGPTSAEKSAGGLDEFERTFPSLDDFGKRFEDEPRSINDRSDEVHGVEEEGMDYTFPDVPSFPELPSVPTSRPGLPPPSGSPPARFEGLKPVGGATAGHDSPPRPDVDRDTKRPSSQPNLTKLDGRVDTSDVDLPDVKHLSLDPASGQSTGHSPRPTPMSPQFTQSPPNGHTPSPQPISFPTPQPAPPPPRQSHTTDGQVRSMKPKFPFSNSITAETLRSYFLNPEVEMVLLDVRSEEENQRGYVGAEYESRGAVVRVVWMDPTVLLRNE